MYLWDSELIDICFNKTFETLSHILTSSKHRNQLFQSAIRNHSKGVLIPFITVTIFDPVQLFMQNQSVIGK